MGPVFSAVVAMAALAIYVSVGYMVLVIVRRKLPSPWAAFAIGVGGVVGALAAFVVLMPFVGRTLESSGTVVAYLASVGVAAVLGSFVGLWSIGRRA